MFYDVKRPEITLAEWERFRGEFPRSLIDEVIDRDAARLPDWFLPAAWGVGIASDELLRRAGHQGIYRPRGWRETSCDSYRLGLGVQTLLVRRSENEDLWTIERWNETRRYEVDEVLGFHFGSTPIFTRTYSAAMRLAMHCHGNEPPTGLRWIKVAPEWIEGAGRIREAAPPRRGVCACHSNCWSPVKV